MESLFHTAWQKLADKPWLLAGLLGLLSFTVFVPAVACDFLNWDDNAYIYRNPVVLGGLTAAGVRRACTDVVFCNWAPLTIISYQLDVSLFGKEPWGFHLTNVLVHAVSSALLYLALFRLTGCPLRSAAAAILFAVHPLRVESVAWIAQRKDVLSVLFLVLALLAYEWYCRRPGMGRYALVFLAMLASLLSKATAVTLPGLLLLLDIWPLGRLPVPGVGGPVGSAGAPSPYPTRSWRRVVTEKLPLLGLAIIFAVITLRTQQKAIQTDIDMPLWAARVPNAILAVAWYIWKTFWPTELHPAYHHTGTEAKPFWLVLVCAAGLTSVIGIAVATARRLPAVPVGLAWFAVALVPVLGLVAQQGFQSHADRFTYVPHIGLMVALVWGAAVVADRLRLGRSLCAAALVTAVVASVAIDRYQIAIWKDSTTLWSHVLASAPDDQLAQSNMGAALFETGRLREAVPYLERSLAIRPSERAHTWLGLALVEQGQLEAAVTQYRAGLAIDASSLEAHTNLGIALAMLGRLTDALPHFERACELAPEDEEARANLVRARSEIAAAAGR